MQKSGEEIRQPFRHDLLLPWNWAAEHPESIRIYRQDERRDREARKRNKRKRRRAEQKRTAKLKKR